MVSTVANLDSVKASDAAAGNSAASTRVNSPEGTTGTVLRVQQEQQQQSCGNNKNSSGETAGLKYGAIKNGCKFRQAPVNNNSYERGLQINTSPIKIKISQYPSDWILSLYILKTRTSKCSNSKTVVNLTNTWARLHNIENIELYNNIELYYTQYKALH